VAVHGGSVAIDPLSPRHAIWRRRSLTSGDPWSTRETVDLETPATSVLTNGPFDVSNVTAVATYATIGNR
jgi:hypothetical protein